MIIHADDFNTPLTDWQQAQFFLWLRQTLTAEQRGALRSALPDVAGHIIQPEFVRGIPTELFDTVRDIAVNQQKKIQAIKTLREHTGWDLERAKEFVEAI